MASGRTACTTKCGTDCFHFLNKGKVYYVLSFPETPSVVHTLCLSHFHKTVPLEYFAHGQLSENHIGRPRQVGGQRSSDTELIDMISCPLFFFLLSSWSCSHAVCSCLMTASPPRAPSSAVTFPALSVAGTTTKPPCPGLW